MKRNIFAIIFILACISPIKAADYYLRSTGGSPHIPGNWTQDPTGITVIGAPSNFSGSHTWYIQNFPSVTLSGNWTVTDGTISVGDGTNTVNWTISGAAQITSTVPINVAANATLNVNKSILLNLNSLHLNSTVVFNTSQSGSIPATDYGNLTIAATNTLGSKLGGTAVNGTLTLNSNLVLSAQALNLFGVIVGSGNFVGDANGASIYTFGSSPGILNFAAGSQSLTLLETSSSGVVILGTDLTIAFSSATTSCYFNLTNGIVDLNGKTLTIADNAEAYFDAGGILRGSTSSAINIRGVGPAILTNLLMETGNNTLKYLSLNRVSSQLGVTSNLNITDSLSVLAGTLTTNGNITLKSTASLKGRVGRVGGSISGNVSIETFIPGSVTGWANLGINGVNGQNIGNWDGQIPMTCNGCTNPTTAISGGFASIAEWDEVAGDYVTGSNSTALTPGKGFWVYVGSSLGTTTDFTLLNTGSLVQGAGTIPVTRTTGSVTANDGFNLIANPYASPVSWTKLRALGTNSTIVTNAIYVWNADLGGGAGATTSYIAGAASPGGGAIGDAIPAGQGFYVEATAAGSITYDESIKSDLNSGSNPLLKTAASNEYGKIFRLKLTGASDWDATVFRIHPEATASYDKNWDAHKLFQSPGYIGYPGPYTHYTTISSKDAVNEDYSIQSISSLSENVSIPVLVKVSASGTYTIQGLDIDDVSDCVLLNDNLLHITTNLKESDYVFSIEDTTSTSRFDLILCKPFTTPVSIAELVYSNMISISQDTQGAFVKTAFEKNTKATISVYNLVGQKLINDMEVEGTTTTTRINLDVHNQVVFIRVLTDKENSVKKIVIH